LAPIYDRFTDGFCDCGHQLKFGRLLYRWIGRLGTSKYFIDVATCTKMQIVYVRTIENQSVIGDEVGLDKSQADAASPRAP
jgi:hypothetical protein